MLLLWDIDGTLIRGARSASQAFVAALRETYQLPDEIAAISYAGKTDQQIVRETLALHHIHEHAVDQHLAAFQQVYIREFSGLETQLKQEIEILPGVRQLLQTLQPVATHALLTGNVQAGARLKLEAAELSHWFNWSVSAFGSDHEQRNQLVPLALQRAAMAGIPATLATTLVIGDTPYDIACAKAGGVRVIAVATGSFDRDELATHKPDALLDTLDDTEAVARLVKRLTT